MYGVLWSVPLWPEKLAEERTEDLAYFRERTLAIKKINVLLIYIVFIIKKYKRIFYQF